MITATLPDPTTLSNYEIRQYDLAYQGTVAAGYTLTPTEQAHWTAVVDEFVARSESLVVELLPHEVEELAG